jgi:hypothetical protein
MDNVQEVCSCKKKKSQTFTFNLPLNGSVRVTSVTTGASFYLDLFFLVTFLGSVWQTVVQFDIGTAL